MTNPEPTSEYVEELEGIEVTKSLDEETFQFPSIVYDLTSERDDDVTVRIVEEIPADLSTEYIGMHPSYGDQHWSIDDQTLAFEYTLSGDEEYRTLYAVRPESRYEATDLFGPSASMDIVPEPTSVAAPSTTGSFTRSAPETATTDVDAEINGDDDQSLTDRPIEKDEESDQPTPTDQVEDDQPTPTEQAEDAQPTPKEQAEEVQPTPTDQAGTEEDTTVAAELAAELEAGTPSSDTLAVLESHFQPAASEGSLTARVDQIQSDVSDLRAYTAALEEFLDENGSAEEVLAAYEDRLETFEDTVTDLQATVDNLEDEMDSIHGEVRDVASTVDDLEDSVAGVRTDVDAVADDVQDLDDRVPGYDVEARIEDLQADIDELSEFLDNLKAAFN